MAENEKVESKTEETQSNFSDIKNDVTNLESKAKRYEGSTENVKENTGDSVLDELSNLEAAMEEYKKKLFLENLESQGIDVSDPAKAIEENIEDFNNFKLSDEQIYAEESPYVSTRKEAIRIIQKRSRQINSLYGENASEKAGKLDALLAEVDSKISEIESILANPDNLQPGEAEKYQKQLDKLNDIKAKIGSRGSISKDNGKTIVSGGSGMLKDCQNCSIQTMATKKSVIRHLDSIMGPYAQNRDVVTKDPIVVDKIGEYDRDRNYLNNTEKGRENKNPTTEEKTEQTEPEEKTEGTENAERTNGENNNQPKSNGNGKAAPNAQNVQAAPVQEAEQVAQQRQFITPEDVMAGNIPQDRLSSIFGITNLSTLDRNYDGAWDVLDMFSSQAIPDKTRLAMLNDPKSRQIIMKAFEEVGTFHPFKGMEHLDTRKSILKLKGPMMEQALKSMPELGLNLSDTKKIADIYKSLPERFDKYEAKINGDPSLSSEEKKAKLEELNKYRDTYSNVNLFQQVKGRVRSPRTLLTELKDYMSDKFSKKGNLQMLSEGSEIESKRREEELNRRFDSQEREQEAPVQEAPVVEEKKQPVNDFQARNAGLVNKADQAVISEETREAKKQEQLAKETQNKNEINQKGEDENTPTVPGE